MNKSKLLFIINEYSVKLYLFCLDWFHEINEKIYKPKFVLYIFFSSYDKFTLTALFGDSLFKSTHKILIEVKCSIV